MTVQPATAPADTSRAVALLAGGKTVQQTADATGWPRSSVLALVKNKPGWLLDSETDKVRRFERMESEDASSPAPSTAPKRSNSVDLLLAEAAVLDDKTVQREHAKTVEAISRLREAVTTATERLAAEQARQEDVRKTLNAIEALEQQLAIAKAHAKELGAHKAGRKPPTRKPENIPAPQASPQEIRKWAAERGIECTQYGRVPIHIRQQYENQNGAPAQ